MAKANSTRKARQPKVYADEEKIKAEIETLAKKAGDNPTDAQKKELKEKRASLGGLKFTRLAKQRLAKAVIAIRNVGKLGGANYTRTEEQIKSVKEYLTNETNAAIAALSATKKEKKGVEITL